MTAPRPVAALFQPGAVVPGDAPAPGPMPAPAPLATTPPAADPAGAMDNTVDPAAATTPAAPTAPPAQPRNPLHGLTLERILTELVAAYGWEGLAAQVPVRCFSLNPSIKSSLQFLRRTPWAREKVEGLYLYYQRWLRRQGA